MTAELISYHPDPQVLIDGWLFEKQNSHVFYPTFHSQFFAWLVKLIRKAEFMYTQPSTWACSLDSQK